MRRYVFVPAILITLTVLISFVSADPARALDDKKKDIKITIRCDVRHGDAPLPIHFVAEIDAPDELDEYIYESSTEWRIMGSFVLTDHITGGNPEDPTMRGNPLTPRENMLYGQKHLVARSRTRAPRKKLKEGEEVKRTYEFDYEFTRPGNYYVIFRLRNGKYSSSEVKIQVRGDTSFDPIRDPY
jgi:hypothetical protein